MKTVYFIAMTLLGSSLAFGQNNHGYDTKESLTIDEEMKVEGWIFAEPIVELWINFNEENKELLINIDQAKLSIGDTIFLGFLKADYETYWVFEEEVNPMKELIVLPLNQEDLDAIKIDGIEYVDINNSISYWFTKKDNKEIVKRVREAFK